MQRADAIELAQSETPSGRKYVHWLPTDLGWGQNHKDRTALGSTALDDYDRFDGLVHATHCATAREILQDRRIKAQAITGYCVANPRYHTADPWLAARYQCLV